MSDVFLDEHTVFGYFTREICVFVCAFLTMCWSRKHYVRNFLFTNRDLALFKGVKLETQSISVIETAQHDDG